MSRPPDRLVKRRRPAWVPPLVAVAVAALFGGLWEGLVYLGLPLPAGSAALSQDHGEVMVLGFLGTLIALERAVALGRTWGYLAPGAAGAGGLAIVAGAPGGVGEALIGCGGVMLVVIFAVICRIQPALHNAVLASAAVCWVVAAGLWLAGWDISKFVPWLAGFLVLTITGERLELSRMTGTSRLGRWLFAVAAGLFGAGLLASLAAGPAAATSSEAVPLGIRVTGTGLIALAAWLARYDIARRTVRGRGVTRYMAAALLAGYAWLAVAGGLWAGVGQMADGGAYDAELHAIFLGFVMSMIFAHAPVIVPSVLRRPLPFRGYLYIPLVLLHVSLIVRLVGGDWAASTDAWQWGGSLNEVAILLFLAMAALLVFRSRRPARRPATIPSGNTPSPDAVATDLEPLRKAARAVRAVLATAVAPSA
ncbi:MAG TPA: hypothetical protein VFO01_08305 [Trebonia sp.]|nr:hypothetical protein [Trebonia sp.]